MVVRTLQDLAHVFSRDRRALVLTAPARGAALRAGRPRQPRQARAARPRSTCARLPRKSSAASRGITELGPPPDADILDKISGALRGLTLFEAERALTRAVLDDLTLGPRDIEVIAEMKKEILSRERVLDCVPEQEGLDDVGGLGGLKGWLEKRRNAFTPEAREFGFPPPRGILLLGVQGCGKSLAAQGGRRRTGRCRCCGSTSGTLYDKYIGESEKNLRDALATGRGAWRPCVLWIDEIEKGFAVRRPARRRRRARRSACFGTLPDLAAGARRAGVRGRHRQRHQALPPELLRKGRFDEIFFVDLPDAARRAPRSSPSTYAPRSSDPARLRPRRARRGHRRLQRRRDRAGGGVGALHGLRPRDGAGHRAHPGGDQGDQAALRHARGRGGVSPRVGAGTRGARGMSMLEGGYRPRPLAGDRGAVLRRLPRRPRRRCHQGRAAASRRRPARAPGKNGMSASFAAINRNKRGIALDLQRPEGTKIAFELARRADVVVENFLPGVAAKLGLGYEAVSAVNPSVVYVSVTGFGQTGPHSKRPATTPSPRA